MKTLLLGLSGLFLLLPQDTYKLEVLSVTNGAGESTGGDHKAKMGVTPLAGRSSAGEFSLLLGPQSMRPTRSLVPAGVHIERVGDKLVTIAWDDILTRIPGSRIQILRSADDQSFALVQSATTGQSATVAAQNGLLLFYALRLQVSAGGTGPRSSSYPAVASANIAKGDLNGDGATDGMDLVELAYRLGLQRSSSGNFWYPGADLNGDRTIDDADLQILEGELGHVF
ncbi:MAG: dockerin type I domain-containing protein [Planctomycetota bacterium]